MIGEDQEKGRVEHEQSGRTACRDKTERNPE